MSSAQISLQQFLMFQLSFKAFEIDFGIGGAGQCFFALETSLRISGYLKKQNNKMLQN